MHHLVRYYDAAVTALLPLHYRKYDTWCFDMAGNPILLILRIHSLLFILIDRPVPVQFCCTLYTTLTTYRYLRIYIVVVYFRCILSTIVLIPGVVHFQLCDGPSVHTSPAHTRMPLFSSSIFLCTSSFIPFILRLSSIIRYLLFILFFHFFHYHPFWLTIIFLLL